VLYQDEPDTVDEDRAITREIWSRMARNANTSLIACLSTTMATTEVAMRLLALNGSPRGPKSNSRFLTDEFLRGFASRRRIKLKPWISRGRAIGKRRSRLFWNSDAVLLGLSTVHGRPCPAW